MTSPILYAKAPMDGLEATDGNPMTNPLEFGHGIPEMKSDEPSRWRPIETAPRDGTHVILAFGQDGVMEGWWEDGDPGPYPWKFVDRGVSGSPFAGGEALNGAREVRGGPSHWQPLPKPPEAP